MKRKIFIVGVAIVFLAGLIACGTTPPTPQTEQERAQLILGAFQDSLNIAFDAGKIYVNAHPEKLTDWQTKVVPMFDMANKILKDLIDKGKAGVPITVEQVNAALTSKINEINAILTGWGVDLKSTKK